MPPLSGLSSFLETKKIILNNYYILYNNRSLLLFDLNGEILYIFNIAPFPDFCYDLEISFSSFLESIYIMDVKIVNENNIIIVFKKRIYLLEIKGKKFKKNIISKENEKISNNNIILIKKNKLLVISQTDNIKIFDIINKRTIQNIYNKSSFLFNFNNTIFINCNDNSLSYYQNIIGTNMYQLTSNMQLNGEKEIIKLDKKTIMVLLDHKKIYLIDIKTMKLNEFHQLSETNNKFIYIYKDKNNFYIYVNNIIYYYTYIKSKFYLRQSINEVYIYTNYFFNRYMGLIERKNDIAQNLFSIQILKDEINKMIVNEIENYELKEMKKNIKIKIFEKNKAKIKNKIIQDKRMMKIKRINNNIKKPKSFKKKFR